MRDRLIELLQNFADGTYTSNGTITDGTKVDDVVDYLIANGVIVPPCKVGNVVKKDNKYYEVYRYECYTDFETPVHFRFWAEPIDDYEEDEIYFWNDEIEEETVIVCTKEEAEKALKEREG